ncbi:Thiazole synthase [Raoultella planticola]|uniref:thiazole synthase n=1 Tax=Raoultella planticola TaxID=575 RepID=A0A485BFW8_RAOPL|nr:Thiazole synthase [Raoultella planticola]
MRLRRWKWALTRYWVNTAIAVADDPVTMARAFRLAIDAGLLARQAGPGARSAQAQATSPLTGFLEALV